MTGLASCRGATLFQPAIFYATHGYPVAEMIHAYWEGAAPGLMQYPESRRVFLPGDKAPAIGQMFRNPDVAGALTILAKEGETAFYKGSDCTGDPEDLDCAGRDHDRGRS